MSTLVRQTNDKIPHNSRYIILKFDGNHVHISVSAPHHIKVRCWEEIHLKIQEEEKKFSALGYQCEIDKEMLLQYATQIIQSKSIFNKLKHKFLTKTKFINCIGKLGIR